jgi:hypothetical protein
VNRSIPDWAAAQSKRKLRATLKNEACNCIIWVGIWPWGVFRDLDCENVTKSENLFEAKVAERSDPERVTFNLTRELHDLVSLFSLSDRAFDPLFERK